jgi:hypothetical protein
MSDMSSMSWHNRRMVDKLKRASLILAFSRVYDRCGPIASMLRRGGQTRHGQVEWLFWLAVAIEIFCQVANTGATPAGRATVSTSARVCSGLQIMATLHPSSFASTCAMAFWWSGEGKRWP